MSKKGSQKNSKKGSLKEGIEQKLTKKQEEVFDLLINQRYTPKQISIRRGTTIRAVNKIIAKLKEKGIINKPLKKVPYFQSTQEKGSLQGIRLHGQEFNIKILYKDHRYKSLKDRSNNIIYDDNVIRLNNDSIEVYSKKSFHSDSAQKATSKSLDYWTKFFIRLENKLNIIIVKNGYENIKQVNAHYADINNELANDALDKKYKIKIYAKEDGKLWFTIDNSFNLKEAETLHPDTAKLDMQEIVEPFFNDMRDNKPPTLSEIMYIIKQSADNNKETAAGLAAMTQILKPKDNTNIKLDTDIPRYIG